MATAGTPASTIPWTRRTPSRPGRDSPAALASASREAMITAIPMIPRRPQASDREPESGRVIARAKVANDSERLATAGEIPNSSTRFGNSG